MIDTEAFGKAVGATLRQARESKGLSLSRMRVKSGGRWSAQALGSWERGDRCLAVEKFADLAQWYGLDAHAVLAEAERAASIPLQRTARSGVRRAA